MRVPRRLPLLAVAAAAAAGLALPAAGAPAAPAYPPLDRPGPPLSVPAAALAQSLTCTASVDRHPPRDVVLLVPGTTLTPTTGFGWNWEPALTRAGRPWCAVELPGSAMGDVQVAGEYVVAAIRAVAARSHRRVDVLGYSQGGMVPRWALRFWPDTRALVDDLVGIDPSNHGTLDTHALCQPVVGCPAAFWQQDSGSAFLRALNSGRETFPGISYTTVYSATDEVVVPNLPGASSSSLADDGGRVRNVLVQSVCPLDTSEHLAMGSYDPAAYALALDAFDHDGPADPARVARSVCLQGVMPGVDPLTFPTDLLAEGAHVATVVATAPRVPAEPPLAAYARG